MNTCLRCVGDIFFIVLVWSFALIGCTGVKQKLSEIRTTIEETISFNDSNSSQSLDNTIKGDADEPPDQHAGPSSQHIVYFKHTVKWHGETLSLIAKWYTGSSRNWKNLVQSNTHIHPNRIRKGDVLLIPPNLLKTREPLPQKVAAKYTPNYFAHTVKLESETLANIAKWYTGDSGNWEKLASVNPKLNPDQLRVGNEIYIPVNLLKTRQPLPAENFQPLSTKPQSETQPPETARSKSENDEDIKLFGPKKFPRS